MSAPCRRARAGRYTMEETYMSERLTDYDDVEIQHADSVTIEEGPGRRWPFGYLLLWVLVVLSLLMNAVLLRQMILWRTAAQEAVDYTLATVEEFEEQRFSQVFVIDDTVRLQTELPVQATIPVTIEQSLPVKANVRVPVDTRLFGVINLDVPIDTTIPVSFTEDIVIDQTFTVDTAVPIHLEVPVDLAVADTPLADTLDGLKARLAVLRTGLDQPLIPLP